MAELRRFADLEYGHPGLLTYFPADNPEDGPGLLHTSRLTTGSLQFNIVGSTAELYPPSKTSTLSYSSQLWRERRLQQRWLLNTHPEACMGNSSFQTYLKEDMERFKRAEETTDRRPLLVVGQMADVRDLTDVKGMPLLAVATGEAGEQLRLARIDQSRWKWGDDKDVTLHLSVIDPAYQEDEVIWMADMLPILQIKAATYFSPHSSVRLLLVQKSTCTTILQPEYRPNPMPESGATGDATHQRLSYINPNPLLTLQHHQTGGNAHSDVSFNPAVLGRPPQLVVLDECGYWSVWNILGTWQVPRKTLRLSQHKCGHISEGFLKAIPSSPSWPAERHGMLLVGRSETDETYHASARRTGTLQTITGPSQYMLLWSSERFEIWDLASDTLLPKLQLLRQTRKRRDKILDVQRSPLDEDHVFVLTTRQVVWVQLFPRAELSEAPSRPVILLACSHVGLGHEDIRMSVAQASADDADNTLVFTYALQTDQLCVYWFGLSPATKLPQWHRHITQMPGREEKKPGTEVRLLRVQPAELEQSLEHPATGPGSRYLQSGVKFYQVIILEKNLGVRYCICTSSSDATLEVTLPTTRLGWSTSEQRRRWKRRRKRFLRHMGDIFVLPDGLNEEKIEALLRRRPVADEETPFKAPEADSALAPRPVLLNMNLIAQKLREQLDLAASQGELGFPATLMEAVHGALKNGLVTGSLPLRTWAELAEELGHPVAYRDVDDGMEEDVERLFDMSDDNMVVTRLGRHIPGELPSSQLSLPYLKRHLSGFWLDPTADKFSEELQRLRRVWVAEVARDVFLSSYGVMVQDVPVLGPGGSDHGQDDHADESTTMASQSPGRSPRIASSSPASPASTAASLPTPPDAALQRLKLLVVSLEPGKLGTTKPPKVLSYWPMERGVGTQDYISSVAVAQDEKFQGARQRLQRVEAKRKAQAEKYRLPASRRQGFPMSDGPSQEDGGRVMRRPPPVQAMSSQLAGPDSSQTQGPAMTASQPVAGAFGTRKRVNKGKRKSGFR